MKYVFFGSPRFAAIILEELIENNTPPLAVIASPDRPTGRKQLITPPDTKILCLKYNIPIHQPEKLTQSELAPLAQEVDFFLVAAYAKIIPLSVLNLPRLGTIGIHPSPLPKFRGASPIQSTILTGTPEAGVSLYLMDAAVDHGPVLRTTLLDTYKPDAWNYQTLEKALAELGAQTFSQVMPDYLAGKLQPTPQDEFQTSMTKKFKTADAKIEEVNLETALRGENIETTRSVLRKILAFSREPGAWTILKKNLQVGKNILPASLRIKILDAELKDSRLVLKLVHIEGRKPQVVEA